MQCNFHLYNSCVPNVQVVSNLSATTGPLFYVESFARFPRERERLFRLIDSSKVGYYYFPVDKLLFRV